MQLLYTTHHSLLHIHVLSPFLSWTLAIGALYGAIRLVIDATRAIRKPLPKPGP